MGVWRTRLRGFFFESTVPDLGNASGGKKSFLSLHFGGFFMKAKETQFLIGAIVLIFSIFGLFGPFLTYGDINLSAVECFEQTANNIGYFCLLLAPFILSFLFAIFALIFKETKWNKYLLFFLSVISGVLFLFSNLFYANSLNIDVDSVTAGNCLIVLGVGMLLVSLYYVSKILESNQFTINDIVEIAMLVSLALVLDLAIFKIKVVAQGGSISLAMVPLVLIALRKGFVKSFIACGIVYGFLNCLIDGYGFITYPLDYLLGFGSLAIVGLFRTLIMNKDAKVTIKGTVFLVVSILLACTGRTIASTISGIVLYDTPFVESLIYQLTYMGPSMIILIVVVLILYRPIMLLNRKYQKSLSK